ncbi:MAG: VOC family protein [Candidatus Binatia bacterium]|nr:VOC family protein [Candidatus Binatia bacterium]
MGEPIRTERPPRLQATFAVLALVLVASCSDIQPPTMPALPSASGAHTPGRIVWIDLLTADFEEAEAFYGPLFGWTFQKTTDPDYRSISLGDEPVAGMIERDEQDNEAEAIWLTYLSVPNVNRASQEAKSSLGRVLMKPQEAPERGRVSVVADSDHAIVVLLRASGGDPAASPVRDGEFLWADLWTHDLKGAARFYKKVAGLEVKTVKKRDGSTQHLLVKDGVATAGLVKLPWKEVQANWLPYVKTADVAATARKAVQLGGKVLLQSKNTAVIQDPEGGAIGIQSKAPKGDPR